MVAACAPAVAPQGLVSATPTIETGDFVTRDGLKLPLRHWDAAAPKAIIVALHGMSDYSEAFDLPGPWWAAHGIEVYAYDQRGFGRAPDPGLWAGADTMRSDLADFVDAARAKYPGVPVYALGESMGGAVVLSSLASARPPHIDGAILVAPAVWSRDDMPVTYTAALWLGAHTLPWVHLSGEGLKIWPSDNIPMLRKLSRDPVYQHDARIDQVYGLVGLMDQARRAPARIAVDPPILLLYGDKDQVIPAPPTKAVITALGTHATVEEYPKGYHMLLRDLEGEKVWGDVAGWIGKANSSSNSVHPPGG
jgi:alpha-beta hydrolase superfamily lysophospholipase